MPPAAVVHELLAVVREQDDERRVGEAEPLELGEKRPEMEVVGGDLRVVEVPQVGQELGARRAPPRHQGVHHLEVADLRVLDPGCERRVLRRRRRVGVVRVDRMHVEEERTLPGTRPQMLKNGAVELVRKDVDGMPVQILDEMLVLVEIAPETELPGHVGVADHGAGLVAEAAEDPGQRRSLGREGVEPPVGAVDLGMEAGEEGRHGGARPGGLRIGGGEEGRLLGEGVNVGRGRPIVAVGAEVVGPQGVDEVDQDVGTAPDAFSRDFRPGRHRGHGRRLNPRLDEAQAAAGRPVGEGRQRDLHGPLRRRRDRQVQRFARPQVDLAAFTGSGPTGRDSQPGAVLGRCCAVLLRRQQGRGAQPASLA
jgi:hypothetical protein